MKHTCGIDGDPGAVTPLDGKCRRCERDKKSNASSAINRDPGIRGGKPVLMGTRIPVCQLIAEVIEDGQSIDQVADDYDTDVEMLRKLFRELASMFPDHR